MTRCVSCGAREPRRLFAAHVCAHAQLPAPPRLDVIAPGVAQAESGTLYLSPSLLMTANRRVGAVDADALARLLGEIVSAIASPAPEVQ